MEGGSSSSELRKLVEAIKISEVVEGRTELIAKLADLQLSEQSDVKSLVESLICMLNKTILHVAAKYLDSDISGCLLQFLLLGTKAGIWCGKHLKMTVMSTDESPEDEHSSLFYQLLLDFLNFSAASFSTMTKYSVFVDDASLVVVEKFILEQLNLAKDAISEIKNIDSIGAEVLKAALAVIDAVQRLCKEYLQVTDWESSGAELENNQGDMNSEQACFKNHITNITTVTIEKLFQLGILAANGGGSLVTLLNVSWKGVVSLLQLAKSKLMVKVKVADIIVTLLSLVNGSLKCAAEAWSSLKDTVSVIEARRIFLPLKFYLINAVKISLLYPSQAYMVYRDLTHCVLMISTFKLSLIHEMPMKNVSEVMTELLEKTSLDLLSSVLNSADVKQEFKYELLDWLFFDNWSDDVNENPVAKCRTNSMDEILSASCEATPSSRAFILGRVALFSSFLRYSFDLEEQIKLGIARKLGWFMNIIIDEEVYSFILASQIPVLLVSGKTVELTWEPMISSLLHALKTFMVVVSSTLAWEELQSFLVKNFLHPHFLCSEITMELWCFLVRHSEIELVIGIIDELCALMNLVASLESVFVPDSSLRKIARSVCMFLTFSTSSVVDHVYSSVMGDERSQLSPFIYSALLLEGFPLTLLSQNMRSIAKEKIVTDYFDSIDSFDDKSLIVSSSEVGVPVLVLSASLQSLQVNISDIDAKTLKFLVAIVCGYRNSTDKLHKDVFCQLLSQTLGIISKLSHLYASDEIEKVILELHNLFVSGPSASDSLLYQCKPALALFMVGLSNVSMTESDNCAKSSAVWGLYHMLLRERHWVFIHLSIAAFGYFAARTSCNQLWKFVPQDAALSYDLESGNDVNEERFMLEFKAFLEKEVALPAVTYSSDQQGPLLEEGLVLKQKVRKISNINFEAASCDRMEIDDENQSKKRRKLPDGINKGVELIQNGLKVIGDSLTQWQPNQIESAELHDKFLTHFSSLENVIAHLVGLSGSV
ncbi:hypothetical protein COLO4_34090 [Corchorus olitorius]|uniref:Uncharacterized protein n=1 Tax=Corchorus olitorius TaxID=93759 RepID=A0A1R3GNP5_9ROSI|nr:hypothetical protein COLO4_34090 [Corchorus olitorius]